MRGLTCLTNILASNKELSDGRAGMEASNLRQAKDSTMALTEIFHNMTLSRDVPIASKASIRK